MSRNMNRNRNRNRNRGRASKAEAASSISELFDDDSSESENENERSNNNNNNNNNNNSTGQRDTESREKSKAVDTMKKEKGGIGNGEEEEEEEEEGEGEYASSGQARDETSGAQQRSTPNVSDARERLHQRGKNRKQQQARNLSSEEEERKEEEEGNGESEDVSLKTCDGSTPIPIPVPNSVHGSISSDTDTGTDTDAEAGANRRGVEDRDEKHARTKCKTEGHDDDQECLGEICASVDNSGNDEDIIHQQLGVPKLRRNSSNYCTKRYATSTPTSASTSAFAAASSSIASATTFPGTSPTRCKELLAPSSPFSVSAKSPSRNWAPSKPSNKLNPKSGNDHKLYHKTKSFRCSSHRGLQDIRQNTRQQQEQEQQQQQQQPTLQEGHAAVEPQQELQHLNQSPCHSHSKIVMRQDQHQYLGQGQGSQQRSEMSAYDYQYMYSNSHSHSDCQDPSWYELASNDVQLQHSGNLGGSGEDVTIDMANNYNDGSQVRDSQQKGKRVNRDRVRLVSLKNSFWDGYNVPLVEQSMQRQDPKSSYSSYSSYSCAPPEQSVPFSSDCPEGLCPMVTISPSSSSSKVISAAESAKKASGLSTSPPPPPRTTTNSIASPVSSTCQEEFHPSTPSASHACTTTATSANTAGTNFSDGGLKDFNQMLQFERPMANDRSSAKPGLYEQYLFDQRSDTIGNSPSNSNRSLSRSFSSMTASSSSSSPVNLTWVVIIAGTIVLVSVFVDEMSIAEPSTSLYSSIHGHFLNRDTPNASLDYIVTVAGALVAFLAMLAWGVSAYFKLAMLRRSSTWRDQVKSTFAMTATPPRTTSTTSVGSP